MKPGVPPAAAESRTSFSEWKGFERPPGGCLLEQQVDLSGPMGFAYERSCDFYKDFHIHDRLMFVVPRGSSVMEVRTRSPAAVYRIDRRHILTVPAHVEHDDEGVSAIYDTLALFPSPSLLQTVTSDLGIQAGEISTLSERCNSLKQTSWLEQLIQEYFFERVISKSRDEGSLHFFEKKIVKEVIRIVTERDDKGESLERRPASAISDDLITRALRYIETNLFEDLSVEEMARYVGASPSTLLRKFKKELRQTPYVYIKGRRLDEAMGLLKTGKHSVGEVAILVGYENFGAFTDAFKSHFGRPPSAFLRES